LPSRYQDRTRITPIGRLQLGSYALIEGEIIKVSLHAAKKTSLTCEVKDETGSLNLRFFHFTLQQKQMLTKGVRLRCFGEVRHAYQRYGFEMIHPEYRSVDDRNLRLENTLTPIYPTTQGVSQTLLRKLMDQGK
jgi:ATP-dependent DNA helicase RecG